MFIALILTISHIILSLVWALNYSKFRKNKKYSKGKIPVSRDRFFKYAGKVIFFIGCFITIASFWSDSFLLLKFHSSPILQIVGIGITFFATTFYVYSLSVLGENYAPCFDSHKPFEIVQRGPYRIIRHPVYSANILNALGVVLASGSFFVFVLGLYGCSKLIRALIHEEKFLISEFPGYQKYMINTWRLAPFIF